MKLNHHLIEFHLTLLILYFIKNKSCDAFSVRTSNLRTYGSVKYYRRMLFTIRAWTDPSPPHPMSHTHDDTAKTNPRDSDISMDDDNKDEDSAIIKARQLLQQAKKLREEATKEENQVHINLMEKKRMQDMETDAMVHCLFDEMNEDPREIQNRSMVQQQRLASPNMVATRILNKRLSLACLQRIIDRLDFLEAEAKGESHVILVMERKDSLATFQKTSSTLSSSPSSPLHTSAQPSALTKNIIQQIQQYRQLLLDAAKILDQGRELEGTHTQHQQHQHRWTPGTLYSHLLERVHFMQREHETQFRKRQDEFYQAAKRKKHFHEAGGEGFIGLHSIYHGKDESKDEKKDKDNNKKKEP